MYYLIELVMIEIFLISVCIALIILAKRQVKVYYLSKYMEMIYQSILLDCKEFQKCDIEIIKKKIKLYNDYYKQYIILRGQKL